MSHYELDCPADYLWISNGDGTFWHIHRDRLSDLACGNATPRNKTETILVKFPSWLEFYLDRMSGDYAVIIPASWPLPNLNPTGFFYHDCLWVLRDDGTWLPIFRDRLGDLAFSDAGPEDETEELLVRNPEWLDYLYRVRQRRLPDDDPGGWAATGIPSVAARIRSRSRQASRNWR